MCFQFRGQQFYWFHSDFCGQQLFSDLHPLFYFSPFGSKHHWKSQLVKILAYMLWDSDQFRTAFSQTFVGRRSRRQLFQLAVVSKKSSLNGFWVRVLELLVRIFLPWTWILLGTMALYCSIQSSQPLSRWSLCLQGRVRPSCVARVMKFYNSMHPPNKAVVLFQGLLEKQAEGDLSP